jgi:hypothetical protein
VGIVLELRKRNDGQAAFTVERSDGSRSSGILGEARTLEALATSLCQEADVSCQELRNDVESLWEICRDLPFGDTLTLRM